MASKCIVYMHITAELFSTPEPRIMIKSMGTECPSVGMLISSKTIGMHIEQQNILGMLRHLSMHIKHLRIHIRQSNPPFPSDPMKVQ